MLNSKTAVFLLGDPASGKGSIANDLCKRYELVDFDMGALLLSKRANSTEVNQSLEGTFDKGNLAPSEVVFELIENFFDKLDSSSPGILFNGHPKKLVELEKSFSFLKLRGYDKILAMYVSIPKEEMIRRVLVRSSYGDSRADDTEKGVEKRLEYFRSDVSMVIKKLSEFCEIEQISGMGGVDVLLGRVVNFLDTKLDFNE